MGKGSFEAKEYQFRVQAPERGNPQKFNTVGKASLDMSRFATSSGGEGVVLAIPTAGRSQARLKVVVAAVAVKGVVEDDVSSVAMSAVSGLSSHSPGPEQDLSGFAFPSQDISSMRLSSGTPTARVSSSGGPSASPSQPPTAGGSASSEATASARVAPTPEQRGQLVELQSQNSSLAKEVAALRQQLAGPGSAGDQALAAAQARVAELEAALHQQQKRQMPAGAELAAGPVVGGEASAVHGQLEAAQGRIASLQAELAASQSALAGAGRGAGAGAAGTVVAAKLALYESKIAALVEEVGGQSEREAELEARLAEGEAALEEAEHMATEAMNMAEEAQVEVDALKKQVGWASWGVGRWKCLSGRAPWWFTVAAVTGRGGCAEEAGGVGLLYWDEGRVRGPMVLHGGCWPSSRWAR